MTTDDALLTEIWSLTDLSALTKRYAAEAKKRDDVGLALARFEALKEDDEVTSDVSAALRTEAVPSSNALVSALVLARCFTEEHAYSVCRWLNEFEDLFPKEALPRLHALFKHAGDRATLARSKKKTQNDANTWEELGVAVAGCLAELGDTKIAEGLLPKQPQLAPTLLNKGIGIDDAIATLEKLEDDDDTLRLAVSLMEALADAQVKRAVPAILRFVRSGVFVHAFAALAKLGDERGAEAARVLLRETCGDAWSVDIVRLSAEHVLRALGEKLPLDLPRAAVHWPIVDYRTNLPEATVLRAMAVSALALQGDAKDKKLAQKQIQSPFRDVREAAKTAFANAKPPVFISWDPGRILWTKKKEGAKALLAALEDPCAVHRHHIVKALAEDSKSKAQIAAFIVASVEERMAMPYDDDVELDPDMEIYLTVGEELASGASKKIFAASKNPYVRVKLLGVDEEEVECRGATMKPDPIPPKTKARVERFDDPPYVFTRGITKLALADDAERMLIIGPESFLFDPQESTRRLSLGDGKDVTACAISPDGARFALARGSKIGIHDGKSGEIVLRLELPGEVTALAFSPDGSQIACGTKASMLSVLDLAANGKELFAGKASGEVRGAGWLGPKRAVFLSDGKASAKKSTLVDVDVPKNKSVDVAVPFATKMATWGKVLATSGDKRARVHDAKLAPKIEVKTDEQVLDLAIESEKSLVLRLEEGLQRVKLGGKEPKLDSISHSPVSGLAASGKRIYALVGDAMTRYHEDEKGKVADGVHFEHVCSIAALPDGRLVTNGWEGRVLLWKPEGGIAETLFDRKQRVDHLSLSPKKDRIYFGDEHTLRCIDLSSREMTCIVGGEDVEDDIAEHMPKVTAVAASTTHVAWAGDDGVHIVDLKTSSEAAHLEMEDVEALAVDDGGRFYASTDDGELRCFDAKGAVLWSRVEHGVDMLKGKLYGDPHRSVAYLATHGSLLASVGSDDTVRVFDGPSGERKLRCMRGVGIFNTAAFSPSEKLFAFTFDNILEVREVDGGALVAQTEDWGEGIECEAMGVAFTDERTLIVGMDNGALFRVMLDGG